jgi:hypothetical protein
MGLTPNFTAESFRKELEKRAANIERAIILQLQALGEELVNHARTLNTYKDQTGNLRASIGYVLIVNGVVFNHNFVTTKAGASTGRQLADELASKAKKGFALIVVAGMDYAGAVESKGYDVLASAEMLASSEFPKLKAKMMSKIQNMK